MLMGGGHDFFIYLIKPEPDLFSEFSSLQKPEPEVRSPTQAQKNQARPKKVILK
jgi:hypothetical protein